MATAPSTPTSLLPAGESNPLQGARPAAFKPSGTSAELRSLEQTLALLNNPEITGARVPADERKAMAEVLRPSAPPTPQDAAGATLPPTGALPSSQEVPAAPTPGPASAPRRIVLTGRTGVGKDFVAARVPGARVLNLDSAIVAWVHDFWPFSPVDSTVIETLRAWGNGDVSQKYPLTPARLLFFEKGRAKWPTFGTPGFWASLAISDEAEGEQVIVPGVANADELKALMAAGFSHYHVICSAASYTGRKKRVNVNDSLAASLDAQVTNALSQGRNGRQLRCIWSDNPPVPPRVMSVGQWVNAVSLVDRPQTGE